MKPINLNLLLEKAVELYTGTASGKIISIMAVPVSEIQKLMEDNTPAKIGRPPITIDRIPEKFMELYPDLLKKEINISELARACNLSRPTVYKYLRLLKEETERQ